MKLPLLLALLISGSAYGQNTITITRGEWSRTITNADFKALEKAIEVDGQPGDKVQLVGEFVGGPLDMLDLTKIVGGELTGIDPSKSRLILTAQIDRIGPEDNPEKPAGPPLRFPEGGSIRIANLYLKGVPENKAEDGALGGWASLGVKGFVPQKATAILEDLQVDAHDWGLVYDWIGKSERTVIMRRVKGVAARGFVNLVSGSSTYALTMDDCEIGIDGSLSVSIGATSAADPVTGGVLTPLIIRAGKAELTNCTFWVKGMIPPKGHPVEWVPVRIASVATDQYNTTGSTATVVSAKNCKVKFVEMNTAKVQSDYDKRTSKANWLWDNKAREDAAKSAGDKLVAEARGGSGPDGSVKVWVP